LTSNASRVAARKLMVDLASGGEEGEPVNKRARLESVVPAPAPTKKKAAATGQPPTSPPRPVPPPLWLSGQPHRLSEGADPDAKTLTRGEEDRCAAIHAAAAAAPTRDREGRSEAACAAAGAAGRWNSNRPHRSKEKVILQLN
jgi:hypothetical protein